MNIIILKNYLEVSEKAGELIASQLKRKKDSVLGLATGSSPLGTYQYLIDQYNKGVISFENTVSLNLDEYVSLPETHPQSYRFFMEKELFSKVNINKNNTHIPKGLAKNTAEECRRYDSLLENTPRDIQLLGLGVNGHIGFNEPGTAFDSRTHIVELQENTIEQNSRFFSSFDEVPKKAITMGIFDIMQANCIILVATGTNKADAVSRMIDHPLNEDCPASVLQNHKNAFIIIDEQAASKLK